MQVLTDIIAVGAGSCVGGIARYLLSRLVQTSAGGLFPWGTLAVNLAGCLLIGIIYGAVSRGFRLDDAMKLFLTVGFCGGFTTFSTFMHEGYLLFSSPRPMIMLSYMALSMVGGLALVYLGYALARIL